MKIFVATQEVFSDDAAYMHYRQTGKAEDRGIAGFWENNGYADFTEREAVHGVDKQDGVEFVNGKWQRKISPLTQAELDEILFTNIERMNQAWKKKRDDAGWDWSSGPLVWENAKGGKPKANAVKNWVKNSLVGTYYQRKQALLTKQIPWSEDLLIFPDCPNTPLEIFIEDAS